MGILILILITSNDEFQIEQEIVWVKAHNLKIDDATTTRQWPQKATTEWFKKKKVCVLEWPGQSRDLNPVEMRDLKRAIYARNAQIPQNQSNRCVSG